uniref:Uncharacterized protein n=1 Tax=Avena sativa TaxID=4498 RepID=A0ACD5YAI5_AVESA
MKKLYQGKGRRVHPAPPPAPDAALALLPAALLALAATLTAEEQEVLAYLLSGIGTGSGGSAGGGRRSSKRHNDPHQPEMGCGCFGCYKSYWARWDASPNRHLIHRIIEAVEEGTAAAGPTGAGATRRGGHRRRRRGRGGRDLDSASPSGAVEADAGLLQVCCASEDGDYEGDEDDGADSVYGGDGEGEDAMTDDSDCASTSNAEKSAVGKLVRFIGEKVWGAWN